MLKHCDIKYVFKSNSPRVRPITRYFDTSGCRLSEMLMCIPLQDTAQRCSHALSGSAIGPSLRSALAVFAGPEASTPAPLCLLVSMAACPPPSKVAVGSL